MKKISTLIVALTILSLSCTNEGRIIRKENRIIGAWAFDRVTFKADGALFRDNLTRDYAGDVIEFFPDYSAIYDDRSLRSIFDGWWEVLLDQDTYYDESGSNTDFEFFLDMCFDDFIANEEFCYFGSICRVNRNRMVIESQDRRGEWTFRLDRL